MGTLCSRCNKSVNNKRTIEEKNSGNSREDIYIPKPSPESPAIPFTDVYFDKEESEQIQRMLQLDFQEAEKRQIINYKKGSLIGEGSYGRVYQGFDEDIGQIIAIKEVDLRKISHLGAKINSFESEIAILSKLHHKNVVKYYGTNRTKESFHIFLEFCIGGSIAKMLDTYKFFNENVIRKYTRQILEGLEYLHAHNVIHRDIKGGNILVERDGLCKLSDFGGAKVIKDEIEFKQQNSFKGTPNWMAPETVKSLEYTRFSDIWSIGCTIIEMATGEPPWAEYKNPMAALYNLMHTSLPPAFPAHLSDTCKHFLSCCLKINPRERLNVCKLLKHPFITGENIEEAKISGGDLKIQVQINKPSDAMQASEEITSPVTINSRDIKFESNPNSEILDKEKEEDTKRISIRIPGRRKSKVKNETNQI